MIELFSSLIVSIQQLSALHPVSQIPVFLIDNSDQKKLSLTIFDELSKEIFSSRIELKLIQGHGNVGYARGHNKALWKLQSKYHLILNPDVQLHEDCLTEGIAYLGKNDHVVLASPYASYEDGEKQYLCKRYPSVLTFLIRGFLPKKLRTLFSARLANYEMHNLLESEPTANIPIASGCFMLCRTDALKRVGGFDESYFLYFEDFDLSLRLGKIGKLAYVPAMRIRHAGGHAARKGFAHMRMFIRSGFRFFTTHGWRFFKQAG